MSQSLKRTCDGATQSSRIQELSGGMQQFMYGPQSKMCWALYLSNGTSIVKPVKHAVLSVAGLVRLLRKNAQHFSSKNREFVSHSLRFEKDAARQVIPSLAASGHL
jgi:hypothetical protein